MSSSENNCDNKAFNRRVIDVVIKISAIALILFMCLQIIHPFLLLVVWAAILAVGLYPLHKKLTKLVKGKKSWASTIIAVIGITLIVIPSVQLSSSAIDSAQHLYTEMDAGTLVVPAPKESVKEWPVVGEKIFMLWSAASEDLTQVGTEYAVQIKALLRNVFSGVMTLGLDIVASIASLIIAVVFMAKSESCYSGISALMKRLMGNAGQRTIDTSVATIRSVATGVLGVAIIQALLSGVGLLVAGIPGAGIWAIFVLFLAVAQLPPIIILGPIAAYYFSVADTTSAVIFLIFSLIVSSSDAFLKPLFLGRGMDIPMLVILLGAIGGMLWAGILGLFVGAVILALGYELLLDWLSHDVEPAKD